MTLCFNYRHSKTLKYTKMMPYSFCHKSHMGIKIACMDTIAKIWELKKSYSLLRHGQAEPSSTSLLWIKAKYIKYRYVKYKTCVT